MGQVNEIILHDSVLKPNIRILKNIQYIYFWKEPITSSTTTKPLYPTLYPKHQPFAPIPSAPMPPRQDEYQRPSEIKKVLISKIF